MTSDTARHGRARRRGWAPWAWLPALGRPRPQQLPRHLHHDLGMAPPPQPVFTFIR